MRENMIKREGRDPIRVVAIAGVAVVAAVAAVVSFEHMRSVAEHAGESWRSWLFPISVDGMVIAATAAAWSARRAGQESSGWTKASLGVGLMVSVGANVLAPFLPDPEAFEWLPPVVAAWPPLALALAAEQVAEIMRGRTEDVREVATEPEQAVELDDVADVETVEIVRPAEAPEADPEWSKAVEWAKRAISSGVPISGYVIGKNAGRTDSWGERALQAAREAVNGAGGAANAVA